MFRTRLIASPSLTSLEASVQILQMPNVYYFKKNKTKTEDMWGAVWAVDKRAVWTAAKKKKNQLLGCRRPHLNKELSLSNDSKICLFLCCLQTLIILWFFSNSQLHDLWKKEESLKRKQACVSFWNFGHESRTPCVCKLGHTGPKEVVLPLTYWEITEQKYSNKQIKWLWMLHIFSC